jgi:hypothetical protein
MNTRIGGIRAFFPNAPVLSKRSSDREPNSKQEQGQQKDRQPTEEEAKQALAVILQMDSIVKNGLQAELECIEGLFVIKVKNSSGQELRGLRGEEIMRLLETAGPGESVNQNRGRILDRRI